MDASQRKIIIVNTLPSGVMVQVSAPENVHEISSTHKIWLRNISKGHLKVSHPESPSRTHALVVRDTQETKVLAQVFFEHPTKDLLFQIHQDKDGIVLEEAIDPTHPPKEIPPAQQGSLLGKVLLPTAGIAGLILCLMLVKNYALVE